MKFLVIGIMTISAMVMMVGLGILMEKYPWVPVMLFVTPIAAGAAWVVYDKFVLGVKSPPWP
jgi:hypothetical protein